jgi:UDP-glucose 4-epimerase
VTGGAGYIGSHICIELLAAGFDIVVVDNLSNSDKKSLQRVVKITGLQFDFHQIDLRDKTALDEVFSNHKIDAVIHLAGLKAVGESCEQPLKYYQNNISASLVLFEMMQKHCVTKLVFSSSATVYGDPATVPIDENFPLTVTNPYGRTKLMIEEMLKDIAAVTSFNVVLLRYFNPAGAHESGLIGEDPNGIPNNLLPYVSQVAVGKRQKVSVFGGDYPTPDGTGVRDYIHVVDLAKGHVKALQAMKKESAKSGQCRVYNIGTGRGYSVLEAIFAFEQACGHKIDYEVVDRRQGDIAECYADVTLANQELNWQAEMSLIDMMRDAWRWQTMNPNGYKDD